MSFEVAHKDEIFSQKELNSGFLATKSVSEFTSTIDDFDPELNIVIKPSEAPRSDFFAAFAIPFFLNILLLNLYLRYFLIKQFYNLAFRHR